MTNISSMRLRYKICVVILKHNLYSIDVLYALASFSEQCWNDVQLYPAVMPIRWPVVRPTDSSLFHGITQACVTRLLISSLVNANNQPVPSITASTNIFQITVCRSHIKMCNDDDFIGEHIWIMNITIISGAVSVPNPSSFLIFF